MLYIVVRNEPKGRRRPHKKRELNDVMRGCEARSLFYICYLIHENAEKNIMLFYLKEYTKNLFITNLSKLFHNMN